MFDRGQVERASAPRRRCASRDTDRLASWRARARPLARDSPTRAAATRTIANDGVMVRAAATKTARSIRPRDSGVADRHDHPRRRRTVDDGHVADRAERLRTELRRPVKSRIRRGREMDRDRERRGRRPANAGSISAAIARRNRQRRAGPASSPASALNARRSGDAGCRERASRNRAPTPAPTTGAIASAKLRRANRPPSSSPRAPSRHLGHATSRIDRQRLLGERLHGAGRQALRPRERVRRARASSTAARDRLRVSRSSFAGGSARRQSAAAATPPSTGAKDRAGCAPRGSAAGSGCGRRPAAAPRPPRAPAAARAETLTAVSPARRGVMCSIAGVDVLARRVLQPPFGDFAATARPLLLRPRRARRAGKRSSRGRRAARPRCAAVSSSSAVPAERPLARPQPLDLQHDHLLRQRVALVLRRHLEPLERHLAGPRDLDEEGVGRGEPGIAGPAVARDRAVDQRVAGRQLQRRQRQRRPRPATPPDARCSVTGSAPSSNSNCSPVPETLV